MSHLPLDQLAENIERHGVPVVVHSGAQGRSARNYTSGYSRGCQANVVHHTASSGTNSSGDIAFIVSGRGEGFVIANAYIGRDGVMHLLASGGTYTEGRGGPRGLIPRDGANRVSNSLEIGNRGDGRQDYTPAQERAAIAWAAESAVLCAEAWGWHDDPFGPDRLFSHAEWAPGRKIDPKGPSKWATDGGIWNMDAFRADARITAAAARTPATATPRQVEEELMFKMTPHLWKHVDHPAVFYISETGNVLHIDEAEYADLLTDEVPLWTSTNDDVYQSRMFLHGGDAPTWVG